MPCKAYSPPRYAAVLLEVSHHFIFGDFLMCLFLSFRAAAQALLHLAEEQSLIVQSLHAPASAGTNTIALLDLSFQSQLDKERKGSKSQVRKKKKPHLYLISKGVCQAQLFICSFFCE